MRLLDAPTFYRAERNGLIHLIVGITTKRQPYPAETQIIGTARCNWTGPVVSQPMTVGQEFISADYTNRACLDCLDLAKLPPLGELPETVDTPVRGVRVAESTVLVQFQNRTTMLVSSPDGIGITVNRNQWAVVAMAKYGPHLTDSFDERLREWPMVTGWYITSTSGSAPLACKLVQGPNGTRTDHHSRPSDTTATKIRGVLKEAIAPFIDGGERAAEGEALRAEGEVAMWGRVLTNAHRSITRLKEDYEADLARLEAFAVLVTALKPGGVSDVPTVAADPDTGMDAVEAPRAPVV